jgi:hypothetical protein
MKKQRTPALPPAVEERLAKRIYITFDVRRGEGSLDRFLKAIRAGATPDPVDLRIVAAQLERVLAGVTFGKAFGRQKGQGRKSSRDVSLRNQAICAEVEELRVEGFKLEAAAELVAQRYKVSPETVTKMHKETNKRHRETLALIRRTEGGKN